MFVVHAVLTLNAPVSEHTAAAPIGGYENQRAIFFAQLIVTMFDQ